MVNLRPAALPQSGYVMGMTRRELPPFHKKDFDTERKHGQAHKQENEKKCFHRNSCFNSANI